MAPSGMILGRKKGEASKSESRVHLSLGISKHLEIFNSVPKEADRQVTLEQTGKPREQDDVICQRLVLQTGMPGSQTSLGELYYFCSK